MERMNEIYSMHGSVPLHFDLFRDDSQDSLPAVICIHGGGWISGERSEVHPIARTLSQEGFAAICPDYRLAPLHPYPAAVCDMLDLVAYLRRNSESLGLSTRRLGCIGLSAGGYLASLLGVLDCKPNAEAGGEGKAAVSAVAAVSAISDLTRPREQLFPVCWSLVDQYMAEPYEGNEALYEQASPLFHVSPRSASFLLIHGEDDDIVPMSQSEIFAVALQDQGVPAEFQPIPGEDHTLSHQGWDNIQALVIEFFRERLVL